MTDQFRIVSIISRALSEACAGSDANDDDPVRAAVAQHQEQTLVLAKSVLAALDKAGLEIVAKPPES